MAGGVVDYRHRFPIKPYPMKDAEREILLSFWKVHILHHADQGPVHGRWLMGELREHGYEISPGTLYPLLDRMERRGWLKSRREGVGARARRSYRLTPRGRQVLKLVREQVAELYEEVVKQAKRKGNQLKR